jgi:hypothetical protein
MNQVHEHKEEMANTQFRHAFAIAKGSMQKSKSLAIPQEMRFPI